VVSSYRHLVKNSCFFLSGGFTIEEAENAISSGEAHIPTFGRLFITNPDLPKRVEQGISLTLDLDFNTLYGPKDWDNDDPEELRKGYTDYAEGRV
jgi:N-ethylmaleimide reductase